MRKIIIFYKTTSACDNTGEVLIYKSLLNQIRKFGKVVIDDRNSDYFDFIKSIGVQDNEKLSSFSRFNFITALMVSAMSSVCNKNRIYLVTGTGEHSYTTSKAAFKNFIAALFLAMLKIFNVRIVRIGMSMYLEGPLPKVSECLLSKFVDYYYVRDSRSMQVCKSSGVKNVQMAPDLSWAYNVCKDVGHDEEEIDSAVFVFRSSLYKDNQKKIDDLVLCINNLASYLINTYNCKIVVSYQVESDRKFSKFLYESLTENYNNISFVDELITLNNAETIYGHSQLLFSNRLHALLLSYKYGAVPYAFIDFEKQQKIVGIFEDEGLSHLLIDMLLFSKENFYINYNSNTSLLKLKTSEKNNRLKVENTMAEIFLEKKP